jgi:2,3-bisphosphoglycerate-independent phosphoglycerate mutase
MKYVVLVPDGMADVPVAELGGKTPLEAAATPNMDAVARQGILLQVTTIPKNVAPASDVANLSILGYDPHLYYSGRAPLEAAHLGIDLRDGDIAFRCNLVTVTDEKMIDYSAGHISSAEAAALIEALNQQFGGASLSFYPGVSYRHLLVLKGLNAKELARCVCAPPHDILNQAAGSFLPSGKGAEILLKLMEGSKKIFEAHAVNKARTVAGKAPATMIWLWGQGQKPKMPTFREKYGLSGAVISAVDLIIGIGKIIGLDVIDVPGATGYYDTNYLGKAQAGIKALETRDFVFVHVEATDEAGHNGDLPMKVTTIERFDKMVVGPFLEHFKDSKDFRLLVLPDHATPVRLRKHTNEPICAGMMGRGIQGAGFRVFSEAESRKSKIYVEGHRLMDLFLKGMEG